MLSRGGMENDAVSWRARLGYAHASQLAERPQALVRPAFKARCLTPTDGRLRRLREALVIAVSHVHGARAIPNQCPYIEWHTLCEVGNAGLGFTPVRTSHPTLDLCGVMRYVTPRDPEFSGQTHGSHLCRRIPEAVSVGNCVGRAAQAAHVGFGSTSR